MVGANGAGKSTTLRTIFGLTTIRGGHVAFKGQEVVGRRPHDLVRMGLAFVPQERSVFPSLTVLENLEMGGYTLAGEKIGRTHRGHADTLPAPEGAPQAEGRLALRRRAPDAGHRPRPDARPGTADARRAIAGAGPAGRGRRLRRGGIHQPAGDDRLPGRAERAARPGHRRSRLRDGAGPRSATRAPAANCSTTKRCNARTWARDAQLSHLTGVVPHHRRLSMASTNRRHRTRRLLRTAQLPAADRGTDPGSPHATMEILETVGVRVLNDEGLQTSAGRRLSHQGWQRGLDPRGAGASHASRARRRRSRSTTARARRRCSSPGATRTSAWAPT